MASVAVVPDAVVDCCCCCGGGGVDCDGVVDDGDGCGDVFVELRLVYLR